jgi:PAS domain S-box-containing protein
MEMPATNKGCGPAHEQSRPDLSESEQRLGRLSALISDIAYSCEADAAGDYSINWIAGAWERVCGYSAAEVMGRGCWMFLVNEADLGLFRENVIGLEAGQHAACELRLRHGNGSTVWVASYAECWPGPEPGGDILYGVLVDVTPRKQAEEALRQSEALLRIAGRTARFGGWSSDPSGTKVTWSDEVALIHDMEPGYCPTAEEAVRFYAQEWRGRIAHAFQECVRQGIPYDEEMEIVTARGRRLWVRTTGEAERDAAGVIIRAHGAFQDITERKQAQQGLVQSQAMLKLVLDTIPQSVYWKDLEGQYLGCNRAFAIAVGLKESVEIVGKDDHDLPWGQDQAEAYRADDLEVMRSRSPKLQITEPLRQADGRELWISTSKVPLADAAGRVFGLLGVYQDITEQRRTEAALRASEDTFRSIVESSPMGIHLYRLGPADRLVLEASNPAADRLTGADNSKLVGKTIEEAFPALAGTEIPERYRRAARYGESWQSELVRYEHGGISGAFAVHAFQITAGRMAVLFEEISARKRQEEENVKLQSQLAQSHKMESVGRLAGGVAHDFNNMLGAILGNVSFALQELPPGSQLREYLEEIEKCAQRSADLTRQLLAFARKQTVAPKVLDLNSTVEGMLKMLRRLIGEDIELMWAPGSELWPVKIDPSQIDQILANLCVNARDAIHGVGRVSLETKNSTVDQSFATSHAGLVPGDYVMLVVRDNGSGMEKDVLAHLFEPFFTTKGPGEGTGLGLATVYGIVRQNQGSILVFSEPGHGSTFTIYLPRYLGKGAELQRVLPPAAPARGQETILLVEDEPALLQVGRRLLESLGYTVIAASTPGEAIRLAEEYRGEIHLLVTDVIMPEMNGRDLAKQLLSLYPGLKRLFTSGYTAEVIAHHGRLGEGIHFLQKPFTLQMLADKVRQTLAAGV